MKTLLPALAGVAVLATAAFAQPVISGADGQYCRALAQKYTTYVGGSEFSPRGRGASPDPEARLALDTCGSSPQTAIPVLEKRLRDNGFDLPSRR